MPVLHASLPMGLVILPLAAALAGGCQRFAPPAEPVMFAPQAGPVYVEPHPTGPQYMAPDSAAGQVPSFPEPLTTTQPPAFAPPPLGATSPALAPQFGLPAAESIEPGLSNPLKVPVHNHDFAWDQIVDVVADYFPIAYEERVRIDSQMWTEGRIETPYQVGSTLFEPQRKDTVGQFNRWQSTLQTIRRRAVVRVVPEADGYLVDVRVDRELEDLPRPEQATAGAASLRNDSSLPSAGRDDVSPTEWSDVWIPLGRDTPLEQEMLAEIQARLAVVPDVPMSVTPVR